jgi:O-antigen/teichoic acid export membrane protein
MPEARIPANTFRLKHKSQEAALQRIFAASLTKTAEVYNVPRGTAYLTSQQVLLYVTYLVFYVLLARILNQTEVGEVAVLALIQALLTGLISGSLPLAATRFISRSIVAGDAQAAAGVARVTLRLSLSLATPVVALAILFSPYLSGFLRGAADPTNLLLVTFIASFFLDLTLLYTAFFIGVGRYAQTLYQNALFVPVSRGLGLVLAYYGFGLFGIGPLRVLGIVMGWAVGGIATVVLSVYLWHGQLPRGASYPLRPILTFSLPVFASALITLGQQWGDLGIIYLLLGATILGPYYLVVSSVNFLSVLWMPVNQAIYPALSAAHSTGDPREVSDRLATAFRLINLTVLPIAAALAAITPTALDIVYGPSYVGEALTLSILSLSSIFVAQGVLLVTTLQAVGHARRYLAVTLVSTIVFVGFVALAAVPIGTLAGAIGRAVLSILIVALARFSLRHEVSTHIDSALSKAVPLAMGVALPLLAIDQFFLMHPPFRPAFQLIILFGAFVVLYGGISRQLRVFHHGDFAMLHDVLPERLRPILKIVQGIIVSGAA